MPDATHPEASPSERSRPSERRGRLGVAVQLVALAVLLVLAFRFLDREQVRLAFESVSLSSFLIFAGLMFSVRMIAAYRWLVVGRDYVGLSGLSFGFLLRVELLADFANIWLQSLVGGEAIRVWKVIQRTGEKRLGPGSVVLDRFVGTLSLAIACLPFLVVLIVQVPSLDLPERLPINVVLLVGAGAVSLLAVVLALRYVEALRRIARRAFESAVRSRFMAVPTVISLAGFPVMVAAHYWGVPELAERSWLVTAMITILPRLGRAIPLSVFGVTAVEGAIFAVGTLLEISPQTILVVVALNLTTRYLGSLAGALAEMSHSGTRFLRDLRRSDLVDPA